MGKLNEQTERACGHVHYPTSSPTSRLPVFYVHAAQQVCLNIVRERERERQRQRESIHIVCACACACVYVCVCVCACRTHMRERRFFAHSDPHGAAIFNGRFLAGMPDDDLLQRPIVASEGGGQNRRSSVLSQFSGLENVLFNDFIDDEPDSEDVSE